MDTDEARTLNDSELMDVVGGGHHNAGTSDTTYVFDTRGRNCGTVTDGVLYYWPCKKCGRPTHMGSGFNQCDKCDEWYWSVSDTAYNGTEAQLKAESAAN